LPNFIFQKSTHPRKGKKKKQWASKEEQKEGGPQGGKGITKY
jgi:hypothetical protein